MKRKQKSGDQTKRRLNQNCAAAGRDGDGVPNTLIFAPKSKQQVARMSAAICGDQDWSPDVASLIRATLAQASPSSHIGLFERSVLVQSHDGAQFELEQSSGDVATRGLPSCGKGPL
jgi:hypothetical protein